MPTSRNESFEQLMAGTPEYLVLDCLRLHISGLTVDAACDLIDRCYAEALNPQSHYYVSSRYAMKLMTTRFAAFRPRSPEQGEVFAYLRAFPHLQPDPEVDEYTDDRDYRVHKSSPAYENRHA